MASLRDIKRKIGSVKNTQKITKAMKMVSAAKMRRAQDSMESARPFAAKIGDVVKNIAQRVNAEAHPFLAQRSEVKNVGVIVVSSDRGLCGAFNSGILRETSAFKRLHADKNVKVLFVGKKGYDFFKNRNTDILEKYTSFGGKFTYDDAITIGQLVTDKFLSEELDELYVIYNAFVSTSSQVPTVKKILPLEVEETDETLVEYIYEPKPELLLNEIMPRFVNFTIFGAMLESTAGEHGARMVAMDNASRNAGDMIRKLSLQYNKLRQAGITTEILDIVNGAEALK